MSAHAHVAKRRHSRVPFFLLCRHSSAHILGEALERHYGCSLCYGPPIEEGYYYDMYAEDTTVSPATYPLIDKLSSKICSAKQVSVSVCDVRSFAHVLV